MISYLSDSSMVSIICVDNFFKRNVRVAPTLIVFLVLYMQSVLRAEMQASQAPLAEVIKSQFICGSYIFRRAYLGADAAAVAFIVHDIFSSAFSRLEYALKHSGHCPCPKNGFGFIMFTVIDVCGDFSDMLLKTFFGKHRFLFIHINTGI